MKLRVDAIFLDYELRFLCTIDVNSFVIRETNLWNYLNNWYSLNDENQNVLLGFIIIYGEFVSNRYRKTIREGIKINCISKIWSIIIQWSILSLPSMNLVIETIVMETRIGKLRMKWKRNNFMIPSVEARYELMTTVNFSQSCYKQDSILFDLSTLEKCTY